MLRYAIALLASTASAFELPAAASSLGRRQAVSAAFGAAAALVAERVSAYDSIPQIEPDFAEMEKQRAARQAVADKKTAQLKAKAKGMRDAKTAGTTAGSSRCSAAASR